MWSFVVHLLLVGLVGVLDLRYKNPMCCFILVVRHRQTYPFEVEKPKLSSLFSYYHPYIRLLYSIFPHYHLTFNIVLIQFYHLSYLHLPIYLG